MTDKSSKNVKVNRIPVRHLKEPQLSGGFIIRDVAQLLNGKDMVQELHRHDFFFILALKHGIGQHTIDFTPYELKDNAVFMMRPGQVHQLVLKAGSTGYMLQFNPDFYPASGELLRQASQQNHYEVSEAALAGLLQPLAAAFYEYQNKQERYQDVILANLGIFFIGLARQQQSKAAGSEGRYRQERLEKFMALLEQHIFDQKQVGQYADMLHLSTYQLNAITKEALGKTTSALINEQITLEAKRCLLATSSQVNQIAYHMGFEDPSYFIRFFKKQTGQSPEAFRHNYR